MTFPSHEMDQCTHMRPFLLHDQLSRALLTIILLHDLQSVNKQGQPILEFDGSDIQIRSKLSIYM